MLKTINALVRYALATASISAFAAAGHPALRQHSLARIRQPAACEHRTTDTIESTDGTESVPSSPSVFQWCQGAWPTFNGGNEKRSLLRYALATASIYGICGHGPSGPCAHIRRRGFANPPLVGMGPLTPLKALMALNPCRHLPQCFSSARGHGRLSAVGTGNAHWGAMCLQRRPFAATGHPALRPHSLARTLPTRCLWAQDH